MTRLYVATTNAGKLRDFGYAAAMAAGALEIMVMPGLHEIPAPAEDELTFEGNAQVKALYYARYAPGEIVLADDSGLEVDALNGAPGVRSARYAEDLGFTAAGDFADLNLDARNNLCLLHHLREVADVNRSSRYRCALVAARDGILIATGQGMVEGLILSKPQGSGGFGYDPYFVPEGGRASMAELDPEQRLRLSHRGRALADLLPKLAGGAPPGGS